MVARALVDPSNELAARGAQLAEVVPRRVDAKGARSAADGELGGTAEPALIEQNTGGDDGQEAQPSRAETRNIELKRRIRVYAAELDQARKELSSARSDAEALATSVKRLTAQRDEALAAVPSRHKRRQLENASRLAADLKSARRQLQELRAEEQSRSQLESAELLAARSALSAAEAERDRAHDARHRLEAKLGDLPGRASYLQNLLRRRIADLATAANGLPPNQKRSRIKREIEQLRELSEHIDRVLPPTVDTEDSQPPDGVGSATASHRPVAYASVDRSLRVEVLGGGSEIGGSAVLVEAGGTQILVDAGVRPNADSPRSAAPPLIATALKGRLEAVIVTHGHNDHAGFVPKLLDDQRQATTICTPATAALLPEMWADARRVMARQADDAAKYGWIAPLYGEAEAEAAERSLQPLQYGRARNVGNLTVQLFNAGHILGAAGVVISAGDQRVVITGDIHDLPQLSVGAAQLPPKLAREADLLVIESTYCQRTHRDRDSQVTDLVRSIEEVVAAGGRVLIPAFGLGRAQEVALIMREHLPDVPVLVDGLARPISEIYQRVADLDIFGGMVQRVDDKRDRLRHMRSFHSGVIITTSGMLTGGFAVPWAQQVLPDAHSALFVCGYQDEESPGRELQRLAERDDPTASATLSLYTEAGPADVQVAARVETYSLSAHADRNGLTNIIDELSPQRTMLVHGLGRDQKEYRETLERAHGRRTVRNDLPWSNSE
jgi:Cft2 family RNA processing exonuclease